MSLLSLVAALLLEQWRPLADRRHLYALLARYATFLERLFNAGEARQGAIAWLLAVLPVVFGAWLVYALAYRASPFLALLLNVAALDWLPVRFTAAAFAVVGDFEDAVYCWRTQAANWPDPALGIVLASGAGAIGVRLGMPILAGGEVVDRPELGLGDAADTGHLDSTVGLVWRALVVWLLVLLLIALAGAST